MEPIVFLNTGLMKEYKGLTEADSEVIGGGAFTGEHGYGHEMFNFKAVDGYVYGYVQTRGYLSLDRLGAKIGAESVSGVLAVFTATVPGENTQIVGWYEQATLYRDHQRMDHPDRQYGGEYFKYLVSAKAEDAVLLTEDQRRAFPRIHRNKPGYMGRHSVWYADSETGLAFREEVRRQIERYWEENRANILP